MRSFCPAATLTLTTDLAWPKKEVRPAGLTWCHHSEQATENGNSLEERCDFRVKTASAGPFSPERRVAIFLGRLLGLTA